MQWDLLGSLASVGLVDPIDEEEDGGETLNVVLVRQFVFDGGVDFGENDAVGLELGGGGGVLWREGLAVAAPGGVELDHDEAVVLDDGSEVALLQNDDVLVIHLERLLRRVVEAWEVAEVAVVVAVVVEPVGIWKMAVVRSGGGVIGFLEEAEIFVVIVVVVVLRGDFIAESEGKGGEEKESGERERNDESFTT